MGKSGLGADAQSASASAGEQENAGEVAPCACCSVSGVCLRSTLKWIIAVVLGVNLLLFAIFSLPVFGKGYPAGKQGSESPQIQIEARFSLGKPVSDVKANVLKLVSDIWEEIGVSNAKVRIISLEPLAPNWTQVVIGVSPNLKNSSISLADLSVLKSNLKTLVLQDSELHLTPDVFGKVYMFQLLKFPGGITVVPDQSGFPLQQVVLFNFTLNNSIFQVDQNLDELKDQLKLFLNVKSSENLFVQLTNSNGSTVDPPIVVQTTVMSVVGTGLPNPRLKQLAQDITGSPAKNLGLNHTTFGNVKQIQLSSYLQYSLTPPTYGAPSPFAAPPSYYPPPHSHHHHHHHHHHHSHHHHHHHSHHHHHHHHYDHDISPSSQPYNLAPSYRLVAPVPLHNHHHFIHAPESRLGGSPSPSYSRSPRGTLGIHHHKVVSAPLAESPIGAPSPHSGPCSKAQPGHSHLPRLLLMFAPPSVGGQFTSLPPFPADTPSTPSASGVSFSLPKSVLITQINIPSPEKSRHSDAEPPNGKSPVLAFSPISASPFGVKPYSQLVFALLHSVGMFLIFLYP